MAKNACQYYRHFAAALQKTGARSGWKASCGWRQICLPAHDGTDKVYKMARKYRYLSTPCVRLLNMMAGIVLHAAKQPCQDRVLAMCDMDTARKAIDALSFSQKIGMTHKPAWHIIHRFCRSCAHNEKKISDVVKANETLSSNKQKVGREWRLASDTYFRRAQLAKLIHGKSRK